MYGNDEKKTDDIFRRVCLAGFGDETSTEIWEKNEFLHQIPEWIILTLAENCIMKKKQIGVDDEYGFKFIMHDEYGFKYNLNI